MESPREPLLPEWKSLPPLGEHEVQVFALRSGGDPGLLPRAHGLLSPAEAERAGRIRVAGAREDFVVARAALRVLLGLATGCPPERVAISIDSFGKPFVPGVHCNMSHSHGLIYLALCRAVPVGVDVEWIDAGLEALEIAEANFTPEEIAPIAAAPAGVERARRFCRLWTRKEAVAKAHGHGLSLSLRDIHVHGAEQGCAWIVAGGTPGAALPRERLEFFLKELAAPENFVAALAIRGPARVVQFPDVT